VGYVDKALSAHLKSILHAGFASLDGSKIADITHADTTDHTLTPKALGLPANAVLLFGLASRVSGSGLIRIRTKVGGAMYSIITAVPFWWPIDEGGVFRYNLQTANDDWDIYGYAYLARGRVAG